MSLNTEYYNEKKRTIRENKKIYSKIYYKEVQKKIQKIKQCQIYNKEYIENNDIVVTVEFGKFVIEL